MNNVVEPYMINVAQKAYKEYASGACEKKSVNLKPSVVEYK